MQCANMAVTVSLMHNLQFQTEVLPPPKELLFLLYKCLWFFTIPFPEQ